MKPNKTVPMYDKVKAISKKISEYSIYIIVALVPVFFLPFTPDYFEFNKSILFITLTLLGLFSWTIGLDDKSNVAIWRSEFEKATLIFAGTLIIPFILSQHWMTSILGFSATLSNSVLFYLSLIIFYFLIRNTLTSKRKITNLVWVIIGSGTAISLITILQYWGVFLIGQIEILRFTTYRTFTTLGYNAVLPFYITALIPFTTFLLIKPKTSLRERISTYICSSLILYTFILVIRNFWTWPGIVLFPVSALSVWYLLKQSKVRIRLSQRKSIVVLVVFFLLFLIHNMPFIENRVVTTQTDVGGQPQLSISTTWKTLTSQFSGSIKEIFVGGGPDTFAYTFSKNKPASYSKSENAGIRFSKAPYQIVDYLSNMGILGLVGWIGFGYFIVLVIKKIFIKKRYTEVSLLLNTFSISIAMILIFSLFIFYTSTIWIMLWSSLAVLSVLYLLHFPNEAEKRTVSFNMFQKNQNPTVKTNFAIILKVITGLLFAFTLFALTRLYIGEVRYKMAEIAINKDSQNQEEKIVNHIQSNNYLTDAIKSFPYRDDYFSDRAIVAVNLLDFYTNLSQNSGEDEVSNTTERNQIQLLATDSVMTAINLNRANVRNYKSAVYVYETLVRITGGEYGTELLGAINSALELEPHDPRLHHKKGIVLYLVEYDGAVEEIERAVELDPIYIPARFDLITIYQTEGNFGQAQDQLEKIIEILEEYSLDELELYGQLKEDLEDFKKGIIPETYQIGGLEEQIEEATEEIEEAK